MTRLKSGLSTFIKYLEKIRKYENTKIFLKDSDTVLDYGCGIGTASCQFSSLAKDIHAIDISSEMIAISKEKAALGKIENVNFEQSDIFDKKYSSESYDVILAFNMLHTVPSPQDVTQRINEILNRDGLFISVTLACDKRCRF
ncbi:MAG: 2-polyprenyl-3-methyl-5-hydroxy-6-metoxy-1,4-benzoquinol methylase [Porticoccus sp.]|jgi:2-polyprenyl-3-methyl-5-hydroxy-6-metoxy-1,4-benzoquinol methylase